MKPGFILVVQQEEPERAQRSATVLPDPDSSSSRPPDLSTQLTRTFPSELIGRRSSRREAS